MGIFETLEEYAKAEEAKRLTERNVAFVMENRQDLVDNYPNRWVAVDDEIIQLVNPDIYELIRIMDGRQALTPSIIFYYSNLFHVPIVVQLYETKPSDSYS